MINVIILIVTGNRKILLIGRKSLVLLSFVLIGTANAVYLSGQNSRRTSPEPKTSSKDVPKKTAAKPPATSGSGTKQDGKTKPAAAPTPDPATEKRRFEEAIAILDPAEKAAALIKFIAEFPKSEFRLRAMESLAVSRAAIAEQNLIAGNADLAIRLLDVAIDEAPKPYSQRLFDEVISKIPAGLYWRGQREAAFRLAQKIEKTVAAEPARLLAIAAFYLSVESASEAQRLAAAVIDLDPTNAAAYVSLGMAYRINFEIEEAEAAYRKATELAPNDTIARRGLADLNRAIGNPALSIEIYQSLLAENENDDAARSGLILSLFEARKTDEAAKMLSKTTEDDSAGVFLLGGAAHWYAVQGNGERAVELARLALAKDPSYIWAQIALARGLILTGKPVEAEQVLVAARRGAKFPTLEYQIAAARLAAGFFREAAEDLSASFRLNEGKLHTQLARRVDREADNFPELIGLETRAAIFSPLPPAGSDEAKLLKLLLRLKQAADAPDTTAAAMIGIAREFAAGDDKMAPHRALYAARFLLSRNLAPDLAKELAEYASARSDDALSVSNSAAAVMASELYDARELAFSRNEFLLIPDVPRQTLSAIYRGRIEETFGLALLADGKPQDAVIRFRRALTVLPKDSAWWRSAVWNLGLGLEASGEEKEALRTYIASYKIDKPNPSRYLRIASLYKRLNGTLDGLDAEIGPSPLASLPDIGEKVSDEVPANSPQPADAQAVVTPEAAPAATIEKVETPQKQPADRDAEKLTETESKVVINTESQRAEALRPRIVPGKEITENDANCTLRPSQNHVSILRNGGTIALLLEFDRDLANDAIKAVSESPEDIEIQRDAEIGNVRGRSLFIIRSLSEKTGDFSVRFESPCAILRVKVTVR